MRTEARFPRIDPGTAHYESFYVKATRPGGGRAVWIRHTVHQRPDEERTASLWFSLFDGAAPGPRATKLTVGAADLSVPTGTLIKIGDAILEPGRAYGAARTDSMALEWDLAFDSPAPSFRHLPYDFLYRAPLPRTKMLSPYPDARYDGTVSVDGETWELDGWPGMLGHNWGAEHAERWSWIQANEFREADAYFDAGLGRIKVGPLTTPWIANAVLGIDGEAHRLGGLDRIRSTEVSETPTGCEFELTGKGIAVRGRVGAQARDFVGWVYADPVPRAGERAGGDAGHQHNAVNCSISDLELTVERKGREAVRLECAGAAAYELGMRETDHGIPLQPYSDG